MSSSVQASPALDPGRRWAPEDTRSLARLLAVVAALHVVGWGVLGLLVVPREFSIGEQVFGWGLGLTAYVFGMRHAFDADHIAVIDSTTRQLTRSAGSSGRRPLSVGFWFSLGHSSVVFAMAIVVATGARFAGGLVTEGTTANHMLAMFGTTAAGVFLWVIGLVNLATLLGILRTARQRRRGQLDDAALAQRLALDGGLARFFHRFSAGIRSPRQVYPVGLLMGLGFDTATEVALLVLAGTAAVALPWYAVLILPVLFTAGMCLFDTLDGAFMNLAYDWASENPLRRLTYNGIVTAISVTIALGIGTVQLVSVLHEQFGLHDAATTWATGLDVRFLGYAVAGFFVLAWTVALFWWRFTQPGPRAVRPLLSAARTVDARGRHPCRSGGRPHG
ncbi:MAG: HoxN/HupN/NixA family nickel/cobalt transporter [Janthinobacterium lividum]